MGVGTSTQFVVGLYNYLKGVEETEGIEAVHQTIEQQIRNMDMIMRDAQEQMRDAQEQMRLHGKTALRTLEYHVPPAISRVNAKTLSMATAAVNKYGNESNNESSNEYGDEPGVDSERKPLEKGKSYKFMFKNNPKIRHAKYLGSKGDSTTQIMFLFKNEGGFTQNEITSKDNVTITKAKSEGGRHKSKKSMCSKNSHTRRVHR